MAVCVEFFTKCCALSSPKPFVFLCEITFGRMRAGKRKTPYKTCRLWRLLGGILRKGSKKVSKPLGFSVLAMCISRRWETLVSLGKINDPEQREKQLRKPYEPCRMQCRNHKIKTTWQKMHKKLLRFQCFLHLRDHVAKPL